jgi:hypothetical protein
VVVGAVPCVRSAAVVRVTLLARNDFGNKDVGNIETAEEVVREGDDAGDTGTSDDPAAEPDRRRDVGRAQCAGHG